jgi:hypothetical protein
MSLPHYRLYPHDTTYTLYRDDPAEEIEVNIEYGVEEYGSPASGLSGPPENYDPGSGALFRTYEKATRLDTEEEITLTPEEIEKFEQWLAEHPEEWEPDPCYYDDY